MKSKLRLHVEKRNFTLNKDQSSSWDSDASTCLMDFSSKIEELISHLKEMGHCPFKEVFTVKL